MSCSRRRFLKGSVAAAAAGFGLGALTQVRFNVRPEVTIFELQQDV